MCDMLLGKLIKIPSSIYAGIRKDSLKDEQLDIIDFGTFLLIDIFYASMILIKIYE